MIFDESFKKYKKTRHKSQYTFHSQFGNIVLYFVPRGTH